MLNYCLHRRVACFNLLRLVSLSRYADKRRGVRVAEGARLESVCTFARTEGSNPSLSAIMPCNTLIVI